MDRVLRFGLVVLAIMVPVVCWAADEDNYVSGYEEAFEKLRHSVDPGYSGDSVEQAISQFYKSGEEDEGTYPATEMWEHDLSVRRTKPERLRYSGRLFFKYSDESIADVEKFEQELELSLRYKDWDAYFRFSDVNSFPNEEEKLAMMKRRIRYRGDKVEVTVGSYGALFGRGLALNMFEDRNLEFDNEVEGVKAEVDIGEADLTVLWGERHRDIGEEKDRPEVTAARIEVPLGDAIDLGAHLVRSEFNREDWRNEYDIYGGDVTIKAGPAKLFVEGVSVEREANEAALHDWDLEGKKGEGYYATLSLAGDGFVLGAEYKDYDGLDQYFTVLPPIKTFPEFASANPDDDEGYGITLNAVPFEDGGAFDFRYVRDNHHDKGAGYMEFGSIYTSDPTQRTSYILEYWDVTKEGEDHYVERVTLNQLLNKDWTASGFFETERIDMPYVDPHRDYIYEAEISYRSLVNIIYTYETTGLELVGGTKWGLWELKWKPTSTQELNVMYGSRRAGQVCSGGVCRMEPEFDGFRADYLFRF